MSASASLLRSGTPFATLSSVSDPIQEIFGLPAPELFEKPELFVQHGPLERFPALRLAYEVLDEGGTAPAVFNAANEVAVAAFLREETSFQEILGTVERTLGSHRGPGANAVPGDLHPPAGNDPSDGEGATRPNLQAILAADRWAREEAARQLQPHRHARGRACGR